MSRHLPERNEHGHLPEYAWPGGAPILYIRPAWWGEEALCGLCATQTPARDLIAWGTHEEGPPMECDRCGRMIVAYYGNPWVLDGIDPEDVPEGMTVEEAMESEEWCADVENLRILAWRLRTMGQVLVSGEDYRGKALSPEQVGRIAERFTRLMRAAQALRGHLSQHMAEEGLPALPEEP